MPPRILPTPFNSGLTRYASQLRACFSGSASTHASNPITGLIDAINPAKTSRSDDPSNFPFTGGFTRDDRSSGAGLMSALQRSITPFARHTVRQTNRAAENTAREKSRALEQQVTRNWNEGDVYAPHDLSPVEQMKARAARQTNSRRSPLRNSRKNGGADLLDQLTVNPVLEYKNFAMMSEFMTEMGRIRHSRETGLRAVNQRKMARAVRRAIGIGIMPSVHRHPELHPDRAAKRTKTTGKMDTSAEQGFNY